MGFEFGDPGDEPILANPGNLAAQVMVFPIKEEESLDFWSNFSFLI